VKLLRDHFDIEVRSAILRSPDSEWQV
jgi:hypothetical protein